MDNNTMKEEPRFKHSKIPALTEQPQNYIWLVTSKKPETKNSFWLSTLAFENPEKAIKEADKQFRSPNKFVITSTITDITSVGRLLFEKFYYDRYDQFVGGIKRIEFRKSEPNEGMPLWNSNSSIQPEWNI